jgi:hypothetical protein
LTDSPEKSQEEIRAEECEFLRTDLPFMLRNVEQRLSAPRSSADSDWYFNLLLKLSAAVAETGAGLLAATDSESAVALAAWYARNMVELRVWVKYCGHSEECAQRFYADALRDVKGIVAALSQMNKLIGQEMPTEQHSYEQLDKIAKEKLGLDGLDLGFVPVSSAAKIVGLDAWYNPTNKYLSKFAHPTAGLVIGLMHQKAFLRDMQSGCLVHGTDAARFCVADLEGIIKATS